MYNAPTPYLRSGLFAFGLLANLLAMGSPAAAADTITVRALTIGVDSYQHTRHLKGAAADARDIATTLRKGGVADVVSLLNGDVTGQRVRSELQSLAARTRAGDIVYLTLAGLGVLEPGQKPAPALLLAGASPKSPAADPERLREPELRAFIGGHLVVVADFSTGTELSREIDPRSNDFSFRTVDATFLKSPNAPVGRECLDTGGFHDVLLLCAEAPSLNIPEINVPGAGYRGALSYAFARALEGAADIDRTGVVTREKLLTYTQRLAYQLTNGRQHVVGAERAGKTDVALASRTRGISVQKANSSAPGAAEADDDDQLVIYSVNPNSQSPALNAGRAGGAAARLDPATRPDQAESQIRPILVAVTNNQEARLAGLVASTPYQVVSSKANPDIIWDPSSGEVLAAGDIIARNIDRSDLAGVIDRMAAIQWLKARATRGPQDVRILPGDQLHNKGSRVEIEVGGISGRSLILFNLAGNGTIQLLYPLGSDAPILNTPIHQETLQVREPFGADQIVAITSNRRMSELENTLSQMDRGRTPVKLTQAIERYMPAGSLVGTTGLYTSP